MMHFGLLLSQLPHVQESHLHYNAMLSLDAGGQSAFKLACASFARRVKAVFA
jgi:hypothetical protein